MATTSEKAIKGSNNASTAGPPAPKSFARRDHLRSIELAVQAKWEESKAFDVHVDSSREKFFINFPYPYMNGRLHLGHAFSMTKAEFTARFQRLQGKNVMFPFGFHCTGMPIQAAANKLRDEIAKYGCPPIFPKEEEQPQQAEEAPEPSPEVEKNAAAQIAAKSKGKKTKLVAKGQAGQKTVWQWDILTKMVPLEEVPQFADPLKWLEYFPPFGISDLKSFGSAIDWQRSFITTSVNPCYDAFVRWQFNRLREGGRINFGKRPSVFCAKDNQVCADHDRASGENVDPQEYTIIKLLILEPYPEGSKLNCPQLAGKRVFLGPATLRPETMYGQTNCFVLPEGDYGAYEIAGGDVLIISDRAAKGLSYQCVMKENGKYESLLQLKGSDLLGLPLKAPLCPYERVYTLPLTTISMGKGTGVVTSVPSDAPDDYAALKELKDKPLWREKFGLTAEMVDPFDVIPIIEIEGYGNLSAKVMCERLDIKSTKDAVKLKAAKDEVYLKGYYEGIMLVGHCAGMKVCDAKPLIRQLLLNSGDAIPYYEPESLVMSRSGEECIVALTDQWYLDYGNEEWVEKVKNHVHSSGFNSYNDKIMEKFDQVLSWLKPWACSRQFGLGTKLPWDDAWVIESLSDSTIYMAYYTIAHILQGNTDNLNGQNNPYGINPADLTDDVFSYIFLHQPLKQPTPIPSNLLDEMRNSFEYWYPFDLRVSAKDLIPNHLTMTLYNHAEIWKSAPKFWPRGMYCNGHIMVDAEKMSKSKGNFLLMEDCVNDYGADATRFALADAGDTMEDANFDRTVANQAVSHLFNEEEWIKSVVAEREAGKLRTGELVFMDTAFLNEMDYLIEATFAEFQKMCYREGIHRCWFDLTIARDLYRDWSQRAGIPLHHDVFNRYVEAVVVMMAPITPHWSEHMWTVIGKSGSLAAAARWPAYSPYDRLLRKKYVFFRDFLKNIRQANLKTKPVAGAAKLCQVYIASVYSPKKIRVLQFMQPLCSLQGQNGVFPEDLLKSMKAFIEGDPDLSSETKMLMQFGAFMRDEAIERGPEALATEMVFDQKSILEENKMYVQSALDLTSISFLNIESEEDSPAIREPKKADTAVPGKPSYSFYSMSS